MSTQTKSDTVASDEIALSKPELASEDVARYLRAHNNFFARHPELVEMLAIPHETGEAVSLVERQVELLRNKNRELGHKLHQLIAVAKENEKVNHRLHVLALGIVSASGFDESLHVIQKLLCTDFPGTRVIVGLFDVLPDTDVKDCEHMETALSKSKLVRDLFSSRRNGVVFLTKRQIGSVFAKKEGKKPIRSAAAVALGGQQHLGVLFLGSTDVDRFQSGMGTLFLTNLGEIISSKLQKFIAG